MKHIAPTIALLLASTLTATAWAKCTTVVADAAGETVVTITAGAGDSCYWEDNNPNDNIPYFLHGTIVDLVPPSTVGFVIEGVYTHANGRAMKRGECISGHDCTPELEGPDIVSPTEPKRRLCSVLNTSADLATGICMFLPAG